MKHGIIAVIIVLILFVLLMGTVNLIFVILQPPNWDLYEYVNEKHRVQFIYPINWNINEQNPNQAIIYNAGSIVMPWPMTDKPLSFRFEDQQYLEYLKFTSQNIADSVSYQNILSDEPAFRDFIYRYVNEMNNSDKLIIEPETIKEYFKNSKFYIAEKEDLRSASFERYNNEVPVNNFIAVTPEGKVYFLELFNGFLQPLGREGVPSFQNAMFDKIVSSFEIVNSGK